jgi:hypothetical protein
MASLDSFLTPEPLASHMVEAIDCGNVETVVDPAAGDGALLECATRRWPTARIVASDIDSTRVRALEQRTSWDVQVGDFLEHNVASSLARHVGSVPTCSVLLNPPFSSRGGTRFNASTGSSRPVSGSRAMAFLLGSTRLVGEQGQLVALVPASVLTSERDAEGRHWLAQRGSLEEISRPSIRLFAGAVATTVVIRWTPQIDQPVDPAIFSRVLSSRTFGWKVIRGSRQMHTVKAVSGLGTVRLVHTTNLIDGHLAGACIRIRPTRADRVLSGPAVLLPRVGRPDSRKIVVHPRGRVALSDCLFAVGHTDVHACYTLREILRANFERVRACYGGTGAPYMRRETLVEMLTEVGVASETG